MSRISTTIAFLRVISVLAIPPLLPAEEQADISSRLDKSLALIQASAKKFTDERTCFSCHHQALPAMAVARAALAGRQIDTAAARQQSEFTAGYYAKLREDLNRGQGVLGGPYSAGYALTSLAADHWPADETTASLAAYLFSRQEADGRWRIETHRPPLEDSDFTATALAIHGLDCYAAADRLEEATRRIANARDWLKQAEPATHEDQTFRLLGLCWAKADQPIIKKPVDRLLSEQREDGGWAQLAELDSDAYATGQALFALREAGKLAAEQPAWRKGIAWLLKNQQEDGSWRVATRAKPIQDYFESGFPHAESQFISISATCWAVMALRPNAAAITIRP